MRRHDLPVAAAAFAAAAAVSRLTLRHVESRWQIMGFCAAVGLYGIAVPGHRGYWRLIQLTLLCVVSAVSIIVVKAALEPDALRVDVHRARSILDRPAPRRPKTETNPQMSSLTPP